LLIQTINDKQTQLLLKCTSIGPTPVVVEAHRQLNSCQGVVTCFDLADLSEEEICNELADQHVTAVKRIYSKKSGTLQPTNSYQITFGLPTLPTHLTVAYYRLQVRPYIPLPLRCFKCQHFGHSATSCNATEICGNCSAPKHCSGPCTAPPLCANCQGSHSAWSRECPKFCEEKRIRELMVLEKIPIAEARRRVKPNTQFSASFASVVTPKRSEGTQTDASTQTPVAQGSSSAQPTSRTSSVSSNLQDDVSRKQPHKTPASTAKGLSPKQQKKLSQNQTHSQKQDRKPTQSSQKTKSHRTQSSSPPGPKKQRHSSGHNYSDAESSVMDADVDDDTTDFIPVGSHKGKNKDKKKVITNC
jgi:hypothetical protein